MTPKTKAPTKLNKTLTNFLSSQQRLANKYGCTVSIGTSKDNMIEIARPDESAVDRKKLEAIHKSRVIREKLKNGELNIQTISPADYAIMRVGMKLESE